MTGGSWLAMGGFAAWMQGALHLDGYWKTAKHARPCRSWPRCPRCRYRSFTAGVWRRCAACRVSVTRWEWLTARRRAASARDAATVAWVQEMKQDLRPLPYETQTVPRAKVAPVAEAAAMERMAVTAEREFPWLERPDWEMPTGQFAAITLGGDDV